MAGRLLWLTVIHSTGSPLSTTPKKLDFNQVLGGHGDVMHGKEKFELWKQYFVTCWMKREKPTPAAQNLEQAQKQVAQFLISKYAAQFDPAFPQSVTANITKAYQVIGFAN